MFEQKFGIEIQPMWPDKAEGSPQEFIADVRSELVRILRSQTGQAIANSLAQIVRLQQLHNAHAQRDSSLFGIKNVSVGLAE